MGLALTCCLAFLLSIVATRLAIPWLARLGAMADENDRTMHLGRIPQGGGAPLLIAAFVALAATAGVNLTFILAVSALAGVSWFDDRAHLSAAVRLPIHIAVAAAYVATLPGDSLVLQGLAPFAIDRVVTVVALAWMMNLYNFMDGVNGIAGAETVAISLGYVLVNWLAIGGDGPHAPMAAALAGASAGFLVWNLRRSALVFLGDVGSVPLGFLTGALMIDLGVNGHWAAALILPAYFFADATLTLLLRFARGERVWQAHRSHFYQRAAQGLDSHLAVVGRIGLVNVLLIGLAAWSLSSPWLTLTIAAVVVAGLLFSLDRAAAARPRSSGSDPSRR